MIKEYNGTGLEVHLVTLLASFCGVPTAEVILSRRGSKGCPSIQAAGYEQMLSELWNLPKACNGPSVYSRRTGASGQEERASWQSDSRYWQPFLAGRWPGGRELAQV